MVSMATAFFKPFFFIFLIIFITTSPNLGAYADGLSLKEGLKLSNPNCGQVIVEKEVIMGRKLLGSSAEAFIDYASPEHNTRHEPRVGSPGGRAMAINP